MNKVEEKIFLIKVLGMLISLKKEILTIDDSGYYIFRPEMVSILKEKKCNSKIIKLLRKCLEIEDIKDLLPEIYYSNLEELIRDTKLLLRRYIMKNEQNLNKSFERIQCNINIKHDFEKNILIETIGILEVINDNIISLNESKVYLFNIKLIEILINKKCNQNLIKLMKNCYELEERDINLQDKLEKLNESAMIQLKGYPELFI